MAFTGYLTEFSLPEIFQFLEQGHKTGLLTLRTLPVQNQEEVQPYYIWLHQGNIVAAADRSDEKGLISMIAQRGWVSDRAALKLFQSCPVNTPMGLCLKSQGLLQAEQLKLLFRTQVVGLVSNLFQLSNAQFEFNAKSILPAAEMTGLSLPATEATLMGLRTLRDWKALAEKLPDPTSGLSSAIIGQPQMKLDSHEWQVWEFANGSITLQQIAKQLTIPIEKVQQIAFRLIVTNLAEEVFMLAVQNAVVTDNGFAGEKLQNPTVEYFSKENINTQSNFASPKENILLESKADRSSKSNVSQSFLQNLVGFLRTKS